MNRVSNGILNPKKNKDTLTVDRLESALDVLAEAIVFMGEEGAKFLPIFKRIEEELVALNARNEALASVISRVKLSRARTVGLSS